MGVLARSVAEAWPTWTEPRSSWQRDASCYEVPVNVFFPEYGGSYDQAREVCSACLVVDACRRMVDRAERELPAGAIFGMFAGETPSERVKRRRLGRLPQASRRAPPANESDRNGRSRLTGLRPPL